MFFSVPFFFFFFLSPPPSVPCVSAPVTHTVRLPWSRTELGLGCSRAGAGSLPPPLRGTGEAAGDHATVGGRACGLEGRGRSATFRRRQRAELTSAPSSHRPPASAPRAAFSPPPPHWPWWLVSPPTWAFVRAKGNSGRRCDANPLLQATQQPLKTSWVMAGWGRRVLLYLSEGWLCFRKERRGKQVTRAASL